MAYNVGEKLEYEITVTVVADDEDPANLNVVALPNTAVDFVNRQYFKAGLYKVSENSGEALKGAVIRLVRVGDGEIIDEVDNRWIDPYHQPDRRSEPEHSAS